MVRESDLYDRVHKALTKLNGACRLYSLRSTIKKRFSQGPNMLSARLFALAINTNVANTMCAQ